MNTNTFGNYLEDVFAEQYHGTDDDMIDAYEAWLDKLAIFEVFFYAEAFSAELNGKLAKALKLVDEAIAELKKIRDMADGK